MDKNAEKLELDKARLALLDSQCTYYANMLTLIREAQAQVKPDLTALDALMATRPEGTADFPHAHTEITHFLDLAQINVTYLLECARRDLAAL